VPGAADGSFHFLHRLVDGEGRRLLARRELLNVARNSAAMVFATRAM
jgi:hypothetical protein